LSAQLAVCVLDQDAVIGDSWDEEWGHEQLQTTFASVPAQGRTHCARLDLLLEFCDQSALPF
jgi:hypothetical protein